MSKNKRAITALATYGEPVGDVVVLGSHMVDGIMVARDLPDGFEVDHGLADDAIALLRSAGFDDAADRLAAIA